MELCGQTPVNTTVIDSPVLGTYYLDNVNHGFLYEGDVIPVPVPGAVGLGILGLALAGYHFRGRSTASGSGPTNLPNRTRVL